MSERGAGRELLPCPFCGTAPHEIKQRVGDQNHVTIFCDNIECGVRMTIGGPRHFRVAAWNRRSATPAPPTVEPSDG